jgi:hypothetical protein
MCDRDTRFSPAKRAGGVIACGLLLVLTTQPAAAEQPAAPAQNASSSAPATSRQPVYATPEAAVEALFQAVQSQNHQAVQQILGAPNELLHTDEPEVDQREREQFVEKYQQMHRLAHRTDGSIVLKVGAENWPFPVPLVPHEGGWRFDPNAGLREVLYRRIGQNELTAMEVCHALADAHREAAEQHETGSSTTASDEVSTFIASVLATGHGHHTPVRFHGYEYRVLTASGDHFAALAYPAAYRSSGVMTFAIDQDGLVYEKDLGARTARAGRALQQFHPDDTWRLAETGEGKNP